MAATPLLRQFSAEPEAHIGWEIHPAYSVEVCSQSTIAQCQSAAAKWTRLSEL
jgi:hypothetical protein